MKEWLERVEKKVDRVEGRLSLLEDSYSTIRATVETTDARTFELVKLDKVCLFCVFLILVLNLSRTSLKLCYTSI